MRVENITWIATKEGNETGNCQVLRDVLAALPYGGQLVILEPGIYDCGTAPLFVPPLVSIEGSGEDTVIRGHVDSPSHGVVDLEGSTTLSRVVVRNTVDTPKHSAIVVSATATQEVLLVVLTDVTTRSSSGAELRYSLYADNTSVRVYGGDYGWGKIWLTGSADFWLFGATFEGVLTDPGITALCYFFRHPSGFAAEGNACPSGL